MASRVSGLSRHTFAEWEPPSIRPWDLQPDPQMALPALRPDPGRARRLAIAYRPKPPERDYFTGDFVGDNNTTFEQLLLNMTKAEWKSAAHPYRMGDDLQRETMVLVADSGRGHAGTLSPKTLTTAQVDNAAPS